MSTYWTDEIDKIKHQKAQLRCDYLQAKRCNSALENEVKTLKEEIVGFLLFCMSNFYVFTFLIFIRLIYFLWLWEFLNIYRSD